MTMIIGAGLSGLIAGHVIKDVPIYESRPRGQLHGAVLRFRSEVVSEATDIPFKKVRVRKGIWYKGEFSQPTIQTCNAYSLKVTRTIGDRSLWNIDPVERYIAPPHFYDRLIENLGGRLKFETPIDIAEEAGTGEKIISTVPLNSTLNALQLGDSPMLDGIDFSHASIYTFQIELDDVDAYQTVYFPSRDYGLYRASLTGSTLICEFVQDTFNENIWLPDLVTAFNLTMEAFEKIDNLLHDAAMDGTKIRTQRYGKIVSLDPGTRRALLLFLTAKHNIYSLGRFATWRNILLDDLVQDARRVKELLHMDDYDLRLSNAR